MTTRISTHVPGISKLNRTKGAVYSVRWRDGERVRSKTFPTMKAAQAFQGRTKAAKAEGGTYTDPHAGRVLFAQVAEDWLAKAAQDVRPRTLQGYERTLRLHVLPTFGGRRVDSITSRDVEVWLLGMKGRMPASVRHAYFPMNAVMRCARRHKLVRANPCEDVTLPKQLPEGRAKVEGHYLSRDQVAALAGHLDAVHPIDGLLVRFATGVGLRASEIAALRVSDLRLARREVFVQRMAKKQYPGGTWLFAETKNRQKRAVPILDDDLFAQLTTYLAGHPRRDEPDAPLWPGRDRYGVTYGAADEDHLWDESTWYRVWFRPAIKALGLPAEAHTGVRFHDLRHTCGSQWLEDGHNMFSVSRWLGHSNISTTDAIYAHVAKTPDYSAALAITRSAQGTG